jgi:hypothetical protein
MKKIHTFIKDLIASNSIQFLASGVHLNLRSKLALIVNAPLVSLHIKNTTNAKSEVRFKQLIRNPRSVHNRLFNANFDRTFN